MTKKMREFKEKLKKNETSCNYFINIEKEREDFEKCRKFFDDISVILKRNYIVVGSCNQDLSAYLVPVGTENQISYYGKPDRSFRVSDHWNWYSSMKRCAKEDEVQCWSMDVQDPKQRDPEHLEKATKPRKVAQVAFYSDYDRKYHAIYGNVWNPKKQVYEWIENDPKEVIYRLLV